MTVCAFESSICVISTYFLMNTYIIIYYTCFIYNRLLVFTIIYLLLILSKKKKSVWHTFKLTTGMVFLICSDSVLSRCHLKVSATLVAPSGNTKLQHILLTALLCVKPPQPKHLNHSSYGACEGMSQVNVGYFDKRSNILGILLDVLLCVMRVCN